MLLRDQVKNLQRRYKNITSDNCFYNDPKELKQSVKNILVWALVQTETQGAFVAKIKFTSRHIRKYTQWVDYWKNSQRPKTREEAAFLKSRRWKAYPSIRKILDERIVPNMGSKYGETWELLEVIGWQLFKGEKK